ncbi:dTDP-4-dehydrorhamnose 3,5-epimerase [Novosphingobium sp. RD2P27]|uniref:dTDP-4-dehydrorhamnose 3,5-epimerase n=1 Tax=Novosphingobium kalidii TaxID=3230299 RepID=A0ABV2D4Z6_9SPHN
MRFLPTAIAGAFIVEADPREDERGSFARTFCAKLFADQGLPSHYPQCSISVNHKRGTLRGLHYQKEPQAEAKLVRVTRGTVFDVAVDLRTESSTYLQWTAVELNAVQRNALAIPAGCAHGYLTLEDNCELYYHLSKDYAPDLAGGIRWDDPLFAIDWPFAPIVIGARDAAYPSYRQEIVR